MTEQATGMNEIAGAAEGMRVQSEQTSRAVKEQANTMRDMTAAAQNTAKQIKAHRQGERRALVGGVRARCSSVRRDSADHRAQRQRRQADPRRHRRPAAPGAGVASRLVDAARKA